MHSPMSSTRLAPDCRGIDSENSLLLIFKQMCLCSSSWIFHNAPTSAYESTLPFEFPMICSLFSFFFVKKKSLRKFETFLKNRITTHSKKLYFKICHSEKEGYIFPVRQVLWLNLTVRLIFLVFTHHHLHTRIHPLSESLY